LPLPRNLTNALIVRSGWLLLAGWLALWPAAEARQAELRLSAVPTAPVSKAGGGCSSNQSADGGCCRGCSGTPARPVSCPDAGSARCVQCQGTGGAALFAQALVVPEPERAALGAIFLGDPVAASRDLRPPVPPPRPFVVTRT